MAGFPENIIDVLEARFKATMGDHAIIRRPLRHADPARSVGMFVVNWVPDQNEAQIGQVEPVLANYFVRIQNMIKAGDEIEGRNLYGVDAKTVRAMLYRDPTLRVEFTGLTEEVLGTVERLQKYGIQTQSFMNNELQGQFVYLATTDLWIQTEITKL